MFKENTINILEAMKKLAEIDFSETPEEAKPDEEDYQRGYIDAINMIIKEFKENL